MDETWRLKFAHWMGNIGRAFRFHSLGLEYGGDGFSCGPWIGCPLKRATD